MGSCVAVEAFIERKRLAGDLDKQHEAALRSSLATRGAEAAIIQPVDPPQTRKCGLGKSANQTYRSNVDVPSHRAHALKVVPPLAPDVPASSSPAAALPHIKLVRRSLKVRRNHALLALRRPSERTSAIFAFFGRRVRA